MKGELWINTLALRIHRIIRRDSHQCEVDEEMLVRESKPFMTIVVLRTGAAAAASGQYSCIISRTFRYTRHVKSPFGYIERITMTASHFANNSD
jgi:hypothetical protein